MSAGRFKSGVHARLKLILASMTELPSMDESYLRVTKILQYIMKNENFSPGFQHASLYLTLIMKFVENIFIDYV